ncbi:hypothetical protein BDV10DRAFT_186214 [Aspergillus recurvatus]
MTIETVLPSINAQGSEHQQLLCECRYDDSGKLASQLVPNKPATLIATKAGGCRTSYLSDGKTYWGQVTQENETHPPQAQLRAADGPDKVLAWVDVTHPTTTSTTSPLPPAGSVEIQKALALTGSGGTPSPAGTIWETAIEYSSGHFSTFGIEINRETFFGAVVGIVGIIVARVFTAGASLPAEIAVGAVVGAVTSAVGGVMGDLAAGKTPTWGSVSTAFGIRLAGGILSPVAAGSEEQLARRSGVVWKRGCWGVFGRSTLLWLCRQQDRQKRGLADRLKRKALRRWGGRPV